MIIKIKTTLQIILSNLADCTYSMSCNETGKDHLLGWGLWKTKLILWFINVNYHCISLHYCILSDRVQACKTDDARFSAFHPITQSTNVQTWALQCGLSMKIVLFMYANDTLALAFGTLVPKTLMWNLLMIFAYIGYSSYNRFIFNFRHFISLSKIRNKNP